MKYLHRYILAIKTILFTIVWNKSNNNFDLKFQSAAANILLCSVGTINNLRKEGKLIEGKHFIKRKRTIWFSKVALLEFRKNIS